MRAHPSPVRSRATQCACGPSRFADHYSPARLFYASQTEPEQNHIVAALVFELSEMETPAIRERVLANLANIDAKLVERRVLRLSIHVPSGGKASASAVAASPCALLAPLTSTAALRSSGPHHSTRGAR